MVSKASDDFPDPDRPVMTVRLSRGMSTDTPFKLCSRAPRTEIWVSMVRSFVPYLFADRKTAGHLRRTHIRAGRCVPGRSFSYAIPASDQEVREMGDGHGHYKQGDGVRRPS